MMTPRVAILLGVLLGIGLLYAGDGAEHGAQKPLKQHAWLVVNRGQYKGMRVRSSSSFSPNYKPDQAFDGDLSSSWLPRSMPCWVEIDLGREVLIGRIVWNADRGAGYHTRIPDIYRFTGSLTGEFRKEHFVITGAEGNYKSSRVAHVFKPVKVRYVRMEIYTTRSDKSRDPRRFQPNVDEIEISAPAVSQEDKHDQHHE